MNKISITLAAISAATLTACGGGGGSVTQTLAAKYGLPAISGAGSGPVTAGELIALDNGLDALNLALALDEVDIQPVQAASVTVNGMVSAPYQNGGEKSLVGKLTLNADFSNAQISGSTSDFVVFSGTAETNLTVDETLTGALTITQAPLTDFGLSFEMPLDGSLTGASGTYTVDADMNGVIAEADATVLALGTVVGTVTVPVAGTTTIQDGAFVATD